MFEVSPSEVNAGQLSVIRQRIFANTGEGIYNGSRIVSDKPTIEMFTERIVPL